MIVATVGHVDHGKTALVKALTGVDTDRLPEEKARGLSIELGFAYRETRSGRSLGFIDVPGHERLVHTMLAGVAGIHHALVVVAADDGPMPQTLEHLAILSLLGIGSASVVVTKVDRVDASRTGEVAARMRTMLPGAPLFEVDALRGDGIDALSAHLDALADAWTPPPARGRFRLAVDRCFTLSGAGVVVTGTVFAGTVRPGDSVLVCPGGLRARVRGLRAHDREAGQGSAGARCALNLAGEEVNRDRIRRGDWIVAEPLAAPTSRLDASFRFLKDCALRGGERVHVHLGAKQAAGRFFVLNEGLIQLSLDEPVGALWGDRFVVRDWQARRTMGGGMVIDPFAPARGRSRPERLAALQAMSRPDAAEALRALLEALPDGVDLERFAVARNLTAGELEQQFGAADMIRVGPTGFAERQWASLRERIIAGVERWHREHPDSWGPDDAQLRALAGAHPPREMLAACVRALLDESRLQRRGNRLHAPQHRPVLSTQQLALWERVEPLLAAGGTRPPSVGHLAAALGTTPKEIEAFLAHAAELGFVLRVAGNRFYPPEGIAALARAAGDLARRHDDGLFSAAEFRDRTGIGRNITIEVLEFLDRSGVTQRVGERRRLVRPPEEVFSDASVSTG
ncbi:MAG: selenocysteine-specific translation elongation factor [Betaproteobacteria bacterium RIFCSPHIGHO2_12_FULL_69_13]|nr:MAG: selenocysteine-specific translation elongation factor [Betaproteobacteria bacterium RIFCSPHIGHO2_12_FULL_69_13]OGA69513.1 MAG: selenocysteine-specific translation elongation factor [Betaproteobacteria bacterium RIFCSPLOWO2_12_FULL_68_20]